MPSAGARRCASSLENRGDALPARRADGDETAPTSRLREDLRERRDDAPAGRGEGMSRRDRAALHVELCAIDAAERFCEAELVAAERFRFPRRERAQDDR